jgi:ATP-dependent exoDNAse (exonuclease V) beta subunit
VVLFDEVLRCFGRLSRRDDVLFLEELNRKAALLFEDDLVTVEELYFRLAARFEHYLIDEFQDTSLSQWRNLALMVEEALSHGGSLFYVGDKKQAIYAFRGGASGLFDALQAQLRDFNVANVALEKNYRSCLEVINFNNRVFGVDNLQAFLQRRLEYSTEKKRDDIHFSQNDFQEIANTFGRSHQLPGKDLKGGVVRVEFLDGRVKEERAVQVRERLIPLIRDLQKRFALKDIAILTRGNRQVQEITQWLLQEGVPASSERSSDIKSNPLITEIMDLLAFLYAPVDNNAFAKFCLGGLMPKATGISAQALQDFLFDCARRKQAQEAYFYQSFQQTFPEVWKAFFEDFVRQAGVYPLYDLVAGIIKRFDCERLFPQYQGFLMHLLELVKRQEAENCGLSAFLDYYENLEGEERFVPMSHAQAVKVLTVHKAKGLEFPVVIIPFLEMDIKAGSGGRDGSQAYMLDIQDEGMSLIRLKESYRQFSPELQQRYEQEYKKSFLVELNTVYVALTRAIEELYVFVPGKVGNTTNPAVFLFPEDYLSIGQPAKTSSPPGGEEAHQKIKPFISDPWVGLREEFLKQKARSPQQARAGEFYHAVLMNVERVSEENMDEVLEKAQSRVIASASSSVIARSAATKQSFFDLHAFINRPDVRPFFYLPPEARVFCEKEFVNAYGDTRRIDRLIVLKDEVQIVDFKLYSPVIPGSSTVIPAKAGIQEDHQKQINEYIELVRPFYPKHKISGHVLYLF